MQQSMQPTPTQTHTHMHTHTHSENPVAYLVRNPHLICWCAAGDLWLLFGGAQGQESLGVWALDLATRRWSAPAIGGVAPGLREGQGAVLLKDTVYVFGGTDRVCVCV